MKFGKMFNAMVSRPVGRKEMMEDPEARAFMRNEWLGQHKQGVYDFTVVREYDDVFREANKTVRKFTCRVHGICAVKIMSGRREVQDASSREEESCWGTRSRINTGSCVLPGPGQPSCEASRWADFYGCVPGNGVKFE